jgi:heterokaryon incompatibility protein (HET)
MSHISYFLICISQHTSQDFIPSDLMDTASVGGKRKRSDTLCTESKPPQTRLKTRSQELDINDSDLAVGPLCARCASVDFDAALSSEQEAVLIQDLGPTNQWSITSCTLCKLLDSLMPEWMRKSRHRFLLSTINSYSAQVEKDIPLLQALPPTKLLGLCERAGTFDIARYIVPQFKGFEPVRLLNTGSIDFSVLNGWLYLCQTMHTRVCNAQRREEISLQHFKLIDCHTRQIVTADHADYIALSYVWGPTEECHEFSEQLPTTLPRTIEDAIIVTQNLGLRYIWIDRYCINQQRKGHAYLQMSQMDLIYQNAIITIVAAARKDPSYGLPGVSRRERRPQLRARIRSTVFVNPWAKTRFLVADSHWATRGWTYQESVLSRRRLVFTDEQVYFECNGMSCYEAFQIPWESLHTSDRQSMEDKYLNGPDYDDALFPFGVDTTSNAIFNRISEYSRKSLTHQSDRLNAFLGILRAFETQDIYHCWGTPILPSPFAPGMKPSKQDLNTGFLLGLCWTQKVSPQVRIPNLPSWSWTGWSSIVWYEGKTHNSLTSVAKIFVELRDGSVLDWSEYQRRYAEINNSVQLSHFIHVWAPTFEIHNLSKETSQSYNCEIKMNDGWFLQWNFFIYHDDSMLSQCQKSFVMASSIQSLKFIVFLKQCGNSFERIWGCWTHSATISLLRPDRKKADVFDPLGSNFIARYGTDWEKSIASPWETLRIG